LLGQKKSFIGSGVFFAMSLIITAAFLFWAPVTIYASALPILILLPLTTTVLESLSLFGLDNVTVPKGLAHRVVNLSRGAPALFHIALASADPSRELVTTFFPKRTMPDVSATHPGGERVTYVKTAARYSPGSSAAFVDFCNADLVPGFEMSGGYGLFQQGGRLPAHLHDFDESICIVQGNATCLVEGRRYNLSDLATALQPRGRVHYFINETPAPMAMLWFYAGPQPERIVVDEKCATEPGVAQSA
jgi:quercetin dioxygenase-like cupin family protein